MSDRDPRPREELTVETGASADVPTPPPLQGLLFRRLNAPDDYARLVRVHRTSRTVDGFDPSSVLLWSPDSADGVARDFAALAEPAVDTVIAEAGGEVVGYANVRTWTERDDLAVYLPLVWLDPAWRERGLEEALLAWGERRAERMAETRSPSGRRVYASNALGTQPALIAALEASGYRLAFSLLEMVLARPSPVAESPVPDGYELRRPTSAGLRPVWEAIHAAYDVAGSVRPTPTEDEWRRFLDNPRSDTNLWRVAWCGEEVAGVVIGEAVADRGEITEVSVVRAHRRRGLARALLGRVLNALADRGLSEVRLRARGNNEQALPLYESFGFRRVAERLSYRKPFPTAAE